MITSTLEYCLDGYNLKECRIESFELLKAKLMQVKKEAIDAINCIFTADVVIVDVGRISIGLDDRSILTYTSADFEKNLTSLGDKFAEGYTMYYFGDYSSISNKYVIPYEKALAVLKIWVETGEMDEMIEWTDDIF